MLTKKAPKKAEKTAKDSKNDPKSANAKVDTLLKSSLNAKPVASQPAKLPASPSKKNAQKTKIIVNCDAGFSNELYIRGEGANLNWSKGQKLKNVSANEWTWECDQSVSKCEFKILINDECFEKGENHSLSEGACFKCKPQFS